MVEIRKNFKIHSKKYKKIDDGYKSRYAFKCSICKKYLSKKFKVDGTDVCMECSKIC